MKTKLNYRLPQTADRQAEFQTGVEDELRRRAQLIGSAGIVSDDDQDVDHEEAACAVVVNTTDVTSIDVLAGTVVFDNGEYVDVSSSDILAVAISTSVTDGQVVRLEYGEVDDGDLEANPYFNFAAKPKTRKKTPREMLVVETVTAYNAQPAEVKLKSVVLGVVRYADTELVVDNGRDTYSFSRPWFSPVDTEHRSQVGSGSVSSTNPHGTSANDLSVGNYSMWQALVGPPSCILARPRAFGRFPGGLCNEVIPAGSFFTDVTGLITGKAGALYAYLGFWPERLLIARRSSDTQEVAAWIPRGRNVIAVWDPALFASAVNLECYYTKVEAGSLPGSILGLTTVEVSDPHEDELIVSGGNFFTALAEKRAIFTDVGFVPMPFDIRVDGQGKVYKTPDVIYCNTKLDTIGSGAVPFTLQPRAPSRLRVALSNFNTGFTEVRLQITGTSESGSVLTEQIVFNSLTSPTLSYTEDTSIRRFSSSAFASVTQLQPIVRNGDGPNTTVTVFAEASPSRPSTGDDLVLASVHWNGAEVSGLYSNNANVVMDRRMVTAGGGNRGMRGIDSALNQPMLVETLFGATPSSTTNWATIVEDFSDPQWMLHPEAAVSTARPVELDPQGLGMRNGYQSRKLPFANSLSHSGSSIDSLFMRMMPRSHHMFPNSSGAISITLTLYATDGTTSTHTGTLPNNPYPPYQVSFTGSLTTSKSYYAASISMSGSTNLDPAELFQGFVFHLRS